MDQTRNIQKFLLKIKKSTCFLNKYVIFDDVLKLNFFAFEVLEYKNVYIMLLIIYIIYLKLLYEYVLILFNKMIYNLQGIH